MITVSNGEFEAIINEAIDHLPKLYVENLKNVAITFEDDPTEQQREKLRLRCDETLFGLYEGVPLTQRGSGYNLVIPDRITIFKGPLQRASTDLMDLKQRVHHTLWHEVAHYYGLNHKRIHELEQK